MSKKKYSHSFLTVFFFPITPRSLAQKFARSPITCSPIHFSLIARYRTITPRFLPSPDRLLPNHSLADTHPIPGFLQSNFLPDRSIAPAKPVLVKLSPRLIAPYHPPITWSYDSPIKILTPSLLFIFFVKQYLSWILCGTCI